jgi:REP element-mobilizing transposase RayT
MAKNPKCYLNNTPIFITGTVQAGLPLAATPYMAVIIEGALAMAQTKYPVILCGYIIMGNHFHLILVVQDPNNVSNFLRYFKGELAHAVNRLLGRNQHTVWIAGCDTPTILTAKTVWEKLRYIYLNPVKANRVEHCAQYPGVSSYEALLAGGMTKQCRKISRDSIPALPERTLSIREQKEFADELLASRGTNCTLRVEPWAFLQCFEQTDKSDQEKLLSTFLKELAEDEELYARSRTKPVAGAHALCLADPRASHTSEKKGKKMICLSEDVELRKSYIEWFKDKREAARQIYRDYRDRKLPLRPPPGFFVPGGMLLSNLFAPFFVGILF